MSAGASASFPRLSRGFQISLGAIALGVLGGVVFLSHAENARLRKRVADSRRHAEEAVRLRAEVNRNRDLLAQLATDKIAGQRAIEAELTRVRANVAELEAQADAAHAAAQAAATRDAESLAHNVDPRLGLTRLEAFRNVGQRTPEAAFQTFVWAALKGEDETMVRLLSITGPARVKAEDVIAALPADARTKYPTPEKLAALFWSAALTGIVAAQIGDASFEDGQHAVIAVRGLTAKTEKISAQLGPEGWQIVVTAGMAEKLRGLALGVRAPPKP
jgi:hypothetical protein